MSGTETTIQNPNRISRLNNLKAVEFSDLHFRSNRPFVLANVWDQGTAQLMSALGAEALATSSAAHAFTLGRADGGELSREEAIDHAIDINEATKLPVNGDLENGFGPTDIDVQLTIKAAIESGLAGCGIEDVQLPLQIPYDFDVAVRRIEAAVDAKNEACAKYGTSFMLTARADGVMIGKYDLTEAIRRIQAFEKAGADVIYVPMPQSFEDLAQIVKSVKVPVNALCAGQFTQYSVKDFANIGIARISLGSSLARAVHKTIVEAARHMFDSGEFTQLSNGVSGSLVDQMLKKGAMKPRD